MGSSYSTTCRSGGSQYFALDLSFNGTGFVSTAVPAASVTTPRVFGVQSDGKMIVAGTSLFGSDYDFSMVRYNTDGSLDTGLGGTGIVTTAFTAATDQPYGLAFQTDGKILLGGQTWNGSAFDYAMARYNTNGSLDTSFNTTGRFTYSPAANSDLINSIAVQVDGKIVTAGNVGTGIANTDFGVMRLNTNGTLDTSFNGTGTRTIAVSGANDFGYALALQSDGKIIISGSTFGQNNCTTIRLNTDGSLDTSFGGTGTVATIVGLAATECRALAVLPSGKILVGAHSLNTSLDIVLVQYNSDGSLDSSFNGNGKSIFANGYGNSIYAMGLQSDGKILVAGSATLGADTPLIVARFNANGTVDTTFSPTGYVTTQLSAFASTAVGVAQQSDGSIMVGAAGTIAGTASFVLLRYKAQ